MINVAVFFGGMSVEHEVSIISGLQAAAALDRSKYYPIPVYIAKDKRMFTGDELFDVKNYTDLKALEQRAQQVMLVRYDNKVLLAPFPQKLFGAKPIEVDLALPVVHGANVEDGSLSGLFESVSLPYACSDVLSSAVCMDKNVTKAVLSQQGLPTLPCLVFDYEEYAETPETQIESATESFGFPVVVKPINLGSSVGISIARDKNALKTALEYAYEFCSRVIVEPAVTNLREINCAVLGDYLYAEPSVCEEPFGGEILSYADKYLSGGGKSEKSGMASTKRQIPANISEELTKQIQDMAVKAFKACGCLGVVRIDFLYDVDKNQVYINELNTIPGSLAFYLWEATAKPFRLLLDEMLRLAQKREREKLTTRTTFETNILEGFISGTGTKTGKYGQ